MSHTLSVSPWILDLARTLSAARTPVPAPDARYYVVAIALDGSKQYFSPTGRWLPANLAHRDWSPEAGAGVWSAQEATQLYMQVSVPFRHVRCLERAS